MKKTSWLSGIISLMVAAVTSTALSQWSVTGDLKAARQNHTATLLKNGKVLIAGGNPNQAELYDPTTGTFSTTGSMSRNRSQGSTATLLLNGRVLVAGGTNAMKSAELFDPDTGLFSATDSLKEVHCYHTATLLPDGRVLIAAGQNNVGPQTHAVAEIYDPATGTFHATGSLVQHRSGHTATLMPNGKVLLAGGIQTTTPGSGIYLNACEIYDPAIGKFTAIAAMKFSRAGLAATLLNDGRVLITGGAGYDARGEIYDYQTGTWSLSGPMQVSKRNWHSATLLANGQVLLAGGYTWKATRSAEIYDPAANAFAFTDSMSTARQSFSAIRLADGRVLVAGGYTGSETSKKAELYSPTTTLVREENDGPDDFSLSQNYPNPFNPVTHIDFTLPASERISIYVYTLTGQKIKALADGERSAGRHRISWDGTSESGVPVTSGLYLIRMEAGSFTAGRKMMLVR